MSEQVIAFPILTKRLLIRNLVMADLADFHFYRSNPEVTKYQGFDVMTIEEAEKFILLNSVRKFGVPGEWVQFGIENTSTGNIIGDCAMRFQKEESRIAEIGITISHEEQKNGFGREVLIAMTNYLFTNWPIHRIVEIVDAENVASINLLRSVGYREEGYFVENIFFKGKWGSEMQFALLRREWEGR